MHNSTGSNLCTDAQVETIKRLFGKMTTTDISIIIKASFTKTKREMQRLGLITDFVEPVKKEKISVEFFDYANEYSYK